MFHLIVLVKDNSVYFKTLSQIAEGFTCFKFVTEVAFLKHSCVI